MPEAELIKWALQFGAGGLFFYLFWETRREMREMDARHEQDIKYLYGRWLNDIKFIAKLPTDLEGDYQLGPDSRVKA